MVWLQCKQPSRLADLASVKLASWISLQAKHFVSDPHNLTATITKNPLNDHIEIIRNHFLEHMPGILHNELFNVLKQQLLEVLSNISPTGRWEDLAERLPLRDVTKRMIKVLFTTKLTYLSFNYDEMYTLGISFSFEPYLLTGVTDLKLDIDFSRHLHENRHMIIDKNIITMLQGLRNLKSLSMSIFMSNIIESIAKNCRMIEKIDLCNYYGMTKRDIEILTKLPNLKSIRLNESFVYRDNKAEYQMMEKMKRWILDSIASLKQFEIKHYLSHGAIALEQLEIVVNNYPQIKNLGFHRISSYETLHGFLEPVHSLQNLNELQIMFYDFYAGYVKELLEVAGAKLQTLHFTGVEELDLNAVKHISLTCPYLQNLTISGCKFEKKLNKFHVANFHGKEIEPFKKLQRLVLNFPNTGLSQESDSENAKDEFILFLLSNCPYAEYINTCETNITEEIMLKVLQNNPLSCLKELTMLRELTKPVLDLIVKNCNEPQVFIKVPKEQI